MRIQTKETFQANQITLEELHKAALMLSHYNCPMAITIKEIYESRRLVIYVKKEDLNGKLNLLFESFIFYYENIIVFSDDKLMYNNQECSKYVHSVSDINLEKNDIMLILSLDYPQKIIENIERRYPNFFSYLHMTKSFINSLLYYAKKIRPIKNLLAIQPNINVILTNWITDNKEKTTDWEQKLLNEDITREKMIQLIESDSIILPEDLYSTKYTKEELLNLHKIPNRDLNGESVLMLKNQQSKHVNIVNNMRVTINQPTEYIKTIYIFGGCSVFGIGVEDSKTIASQLQRLINETKLSKSIRVVNCGNFIFGKADAMWYNINFEKFNNGDIVVVPLIDKWAEIFYKEAQNITFFDCAKRNTCKGELFNDREHPSENGMGMIALKLYNHLVDNEFFYKTTNYESGKTWGRSLQYVKTYGLPAFSNALLGKNKNDISLGANYNEELNLYLNELRQYRRKNGAIVMNCNPFTLGHRYLIEYASKKVDHLYIFAVEEDKSVFPFKERIFLIKEGTKDLNNVTVLPSGKFIISKLTFTDYFGKDEIQNKEIDPSLDIEIFANKIAPELNINVRFAGEEPLDKITKQYNAYMDKILTKHNIEFIEIPRKMEGNNVISASRVRAFIKENKWAEIAKIVPQTTLGYLQQKFRKKANVSLLGVDVCTGCSLCANICPMNAIVMNKDSYGFDLPSVSFACIDCGKCLAKCPQLNDSLNLNESNVSYAAWAKPSVRYRGSSGGMFGVFSQKILDKGGAVYGAGFNDDFSKLKLMRATNHKEIEKLYKSKYIQSSIENGYKEIKKDLQSGKNVLYCGCPCQVDALLSFLGGRHVNLITIDLLCHGVPSPNALNKIIEEVRNGRTIKLIDFRDKKKGWSAGLNIIFSDGSTYEEDSKGGFYQAFSKGLSLRPSCYKCKYAQQKRVGDLTIGDFWGVWEINKSLNDNKGTSMILCNTKEGESFYANCVEEFERSAKIKQADLLENAKKFNGAMLHPTPYNEMWKCFYEHIQRDSFRKSVRYAEKAIMDIGILGWWIETSASNYGSTLTAFALYQYLTEEGYSVAFISPPNFDRQTAGGFNIRQNYRMTAKYNAENMKENNKYFDAYIVGSDVLWYYDAMMSSAGYSFLLDFADETTKKIAYSTSFGRTNSFFPPEQMPKAKTLLDRFDSIGLREYEGVEICRDRFDISATHVLDPVFLCSQNAWDKLSSKATRKTKERYMLAYMLDPTEEKAEKLQQIANELGLILVSIVDKQFDREKKMKIMEEFGLLPNPTIEEFIYHFEHAEFIVTDSYHGMCFSLVFRRNFVALVNMKRGASRFLTLGKCLNVADRMIEDIKEIILNKEMLLSIDYSTIGNKIEQEINRSATWLIDAISKSEK